MTNLLERPSALVPAPMDGRLAFLTGPNLHPWDADAMVFMAAAVSGEHPYTGAADADDLPIDAVPLPEGFEVVGRYRGAVRHRVRAGSSDAAVLIARDGRETVIWWSAATAERCERVDRACAASQGPDTSCPGPGIRLPEPASRSSAGSPCWPLRLTPQRAPRLRSMLDRDSIK